MLHQSDKQAVFSASSIGRRQAGRLVEYDEIVIFVQNLDPCVISF